MKHVMHVGLALALAAAPAAAQSMSTGTQQSDSPVATTLRAAARRASENLIGAAQDMPAAKYGYKPTDGQRTFGALVLHVAGSNDFMCSTISGMKAPARPKLTATDSKAKLVDALKASFAFCTSALAKLDDSHLGDQVKFFGNRQVSRATVEMGLADDWADHYAQAAGYLRLNGILPPTARRRGGM